MRVFFVRKDTVDCTADPHPVDFKDYEAAFAAIEKVVNNDIVESIEDVELDLMPKGMLRKDVGFDECENFKSDHFAHSDFDKRKKLQDSPWAKENKTYGLYLTFDATVPKDHHLPPGLRGVKAALEVARKNIGRFYALRIGVTWRFAGDNSCSDYIEMPDEDHLDSGDCVVDFSNQDWFISKEGYKAHCAELSKILGIPHSIIPTEE